ncbi:MAG: Hsp70 family protein [Myxococcota bacterium]|nr:Hsp70 family protein [Myxococcota bacterium]
MSWMERPVGIDLGTTNSLCAMLDPSGQNLLLAEDARGRSIIPSLLAKDEKNEGLLSGYAAIDPRRDPRQSISSVKRKMGKRQTLELGAEQYTPEQLSAMILRSQRETMQAYLERKGLKELWGTGQVPNRQELGRAGQVPNRQELGRAGQVPNRQEIRVQRAVVTVPAYFDAPQIEATREAARLAEIELLALLQEPTAACMYYVWKRGLSDGNFLVYDLGGGTFDVSVIRCMLGEYQVLAIDGDNFLGGDDFDRRLADRLRQSLRDQGHALAEGLERPEDVSRFEQLVRVAKRAKEQLSSQPLVSIREQALFQDDEEEWVSLEYDLSREAFDEWTKDLVESTISCCLRALEQSQQRAQVALPDIDAVLLVGGSTRIPSVLKRVTAALCGEGKSRAQEPISESPDAAVALGAAIHAANLGGLRMGSELGPFRLHLYSPLGTQSQRFRLVGELEAEEDSASLDEVQTILLKNELGTTLGIETLHEGRRFRFSELRLEEEGPQRWVLELLSASGATLGEFSLPVHRSSALKQTGSALSNPTVLAKPIFLEVRRLGELERKELIGRGAALPASGRFTFYTADQSGAVVLTLLQNRFPIHTIHIETPRDLPIGTALSLLLEMDEKHVITVSGEVAGAAFEARVEAPPEEPLRDWAEVEQLLDEAEKLGKQLWGHDAFFYRRDVPNLLSSIREAARTDPDKLTVLVGRLESELEGLRGGIGELSPGVDRYRLLLDGVRRMVLRGEEVLGLGFEAWVERLDKMWSEAEAAYLAHDQKRWSRSYTQLQALYETLSQAESRFVSTNSAEHIAGLLRLARTLANRIEDRIANMVLPTQPELRRLRAKALREIELDYERSVVDELARLEANPVASAETRAHVEGLIGLQQTLLRRLDGIPSLGVVESQD